MDQAINVLWQLRRPDVYNFAYPTFAAIGMAESGLDTHAMNLNDYDPTSVSYLSVDWGWLQINDYWQGMDIATCRRMLDPHECAARALEIFAQRNKSHGYGEGYKLWNSYTNDKHRPFLSAALTAARKAGIPGV